MYKSLAAVVLALALSPLALTAPTNTEAARSYTSECVTCYVSSLVLPKACDVCI
jgi:hypothetical protein